MESTYLFSLTALAYLSDAIGTANFEPNPVQKLVLKGALQFLDMELSHQVDRHPEFVEMINQLLTHTPTECSREQTQNIH